MLLQRGDKLLFIGDSITDAGRDPDGEPAPWRPHYGLGTGYVCMVWAWLQAAHPELRLQVLNRGVCGHTVRDLAARWQRDALEPAPSVLSVMIGINDVWRQFDQPAVPGAGVPPEEYRTTLRRLVEQARPVTRHILMASPFFIEPRKDDPLRARMEEYGAIVREIAAATGAIFVDTQAGFDEVLRHVHASWLAWDRIHPGPHGHMILARAFLRALGALPAGGC